MDQWAWTEKERSLVIMPTSILGQRLQEFGLERERIADRDCLAVANPGQTLEQAIVAVAKHDPTLFETLGRANEQDLHLVDGLNGAHRHGQRHGAFLDRKRGVYQRAGPPVAVGVGDLGDHARRMSVPVHYRADEDDLADGAP